MSTQQQLYESSRQRLADSDHAFMELINHKTNPMTNADLAALIERRPEKYSRYSKYIGKLKD